MKKQLRKILRFGGVGFLVLLAACVSTQKRLLDSDSGQLQTRSIQTRAFDSTDRERILRTAMGTLQDFGFVIDAGDVGLGAVTGVKRVGSDVMRITVSVRARGETQTSVRANCQIGNEPVKDPVSYQRFFAALSKAIYLEAHQID